MKIRTFSIITLFLLTFSTTASATKFNTFVPGLLGETSKTVQAWNMAPSSFMAEGRTNIYLENVKKPMHAWMLAFTPGAYSMLVTMVNKFKDQDGDEKFLEKSKYYFAAIPTAMGSLYAQRYWEAVVIWGGQAVGSYFIWSYFNTIRSERNNNINNFYIGVGMYAFFWVVDMIYAPVMSWQYNKKLAKLYLSEGNSVSASSSIINSVPSMGNVSIGPGINVPAPFTIGTTFHF